MNRRAANLSGGAVLIVTVLIGVFLGINVHNLGQFLVTILVTMIGAVLGVIVWYLVAEWESMS